MEGEFREEVVVDWRCSFRPNRQGQAVTGLTRAGAVVTQSKLLSRMVVKAYYCLLLPVRLGSC